MHILNHILIVAFLFDRNIHLCIILSLYTRYISIRHPNVGCPHFVDRCNGGEQSAYPGLRLPTRLLR